MIRKTHDNVLAHLPSDNPGGGRPAGNTFGKHLIIDLTGCTFRVSDASAIAVYATEVVELLGMKAYGEPQVHHFGHDSPDTSGYTGVQVMLLQLIETSSITGHFVDAVRTAHLDLFSCRDFDDEAALSHAEEFFGATASVATVLYR